MPEHSAPRYTHRPRRARGRSIHEVATPIPSSDRLGAHGGVSSVGSAGRQTGAPPRHNPRSALVLPPRPTSIIGREQDLALARRRLARADVRLLTLTGPPGVGKTRLALEVAADVLDEFDDGAWFVDLAPIGDPRLVPDATARALGLHDVGRRAPADLLEDVLRDKSLLLVLDNFEQVLDAADVVGRLLAACPKLKVVATSRAPLHLSWERELPVPPLELPDLDGRPAAEALAAAPAAQLFLERARAVVPDFVLGDAEAAAVAEICVHLDGLPLAIELAAARTKLLPPRALLRRLVGAGAGAAASREAHLLSPLRLLGGGARDVPPRQQTLRRAIAWSYELLDPDEQALFRRLAVFVGGCTLGAAGRVAGVGCWVLGDAGDTFSSPDTQPPAPNTLDLVASLVDKNLVWREEQPDGEPRLRLLETLREFGLEQLRADGELEAIRGRHAAYFVALAERAAPELSGPEQVAWLDRLEPERANLRAVLEWSAERDEVEAGLRLGGALWRFWLVRGQAREARARLADLLARGRGGPLTPVRAGALVGAGVLARHVGDYPTARALFEESLAVALELDEPRSVAVVLHHLGWLAYLEGDLATARSLGEQSLDTFRALGDTSASADVLHSLGFVAHLQNDYATARAWYEESLALQREVGNTRGVALALHNLGLSAVLLKGELAAARRWYGESLRLFRELGDRQNIAMALGNLGDVALLQRDHAASQELHHECLVTAAEVGDRRRIAFSLAGVAVLAAAQSQPERALRLAAAAAALREAIGAAPDRAWQARLEPGLAAARASFGRQAGARAWAEGAAMTPGEAVAYALSEPDQDEAAPTDSLTAREREVASLIAAGLTNRQIAEALVVTEGTAANYVQRVLTRLDFNSRAQIAAWAVEHGLGPSPHHLSRATGS